MALAVAFLRGINVGGRVVKKEKLVDVFTKLGFEDVSTYKQSGNMVFDTSEPGNERDRAKIEDRLRKALGYDVPAFIRTLEYLKKMVEKGPPGRRKSAGTSFLVTFLPDLLPNPLPDLPLVIPGSTAKIVSASGLEVYSLSHGGGEGGLPNQFLEAKLKVKTTTRNMNVVREIVQRYG